MTGRIVHFEIPFDDGDRARSFYKEAFGWSVEEMPQMGYTMLSTGPVSEQGMPTEPGYINGGMAKREGALTTPVVTVDVEDIDAAVQKIQALGGSSVGDKMEVGEMGWAAYFKDTEGNVVGLWQTKVPG